MAPPKKSAEENELRGNPGKRPNPVAPVDVLPPSPMPAPHYLSARAKQFWDEYAPDLIAVRFVRTTDAPLFALVCETVAEAFESKEILERDGYTYETHTPHGSMIRLHPRYAVLDRARRVLVPLFDRFGMSPAARLSILSKLAATPGRDPANAPGPVIDDTADLFADDPLSDAGPFGALN